MKSVKWPLRFGVLQASQTQAIHPDALCRSQLQTVHTLVGESGCWYRGLRNGGQSVQRVINNLHAWGLKHRPVDFDSANAGQAKSVNACSLTTVPSRVGSV